MNRTRPHEISQQKHCGVPLGHLVGFDRVCRFRTNNRSLKYKKERVFFRDLNDSDR